MSVSLPAVPASCLLYAYSSPAAPLFDPLVKPSTGAARLPFVTIRFEPATKVIPGMASVAIF
jgi:hypothetical protein